MKNNVLNQLPVIILIGFFVLVPLSRWQIFFDSYLVKLWLVQCGLAVVAVIFSYQLLRGEIAFSIYLPFFILLLLYLAINIISWIIVPVPYRYAAQATVTAFVTYIILCCFVTQYLDTVRYKEAAVIAWITATVIVALIGMYHYYIGFRVISTLGNENFLASHLTMTIPVTLGFFLRYWQRQKRIKRQGLLLTLGLLILILLTTVLYQTRSRGSWLGLGFALIGFMIFAWLKPGKRMLAWFFIIIIVGVILITPSGIDFATNQLRGGVRLPIWEATVFMITQQPWLGWGKGAYFIFYPQFRVNYYWLTKGPTDLTTHAHNEYLQILAETGLIGLLAFFLLIFLVFKIGVRRIEEAADREQCYLFIGLVSGLIGLLVHNIVCNNLQLPSSAIFLWLTIGLIMGRRSAAAGLFRLNNLVSCTAAVVIAVFISIITWNFAGRQMMAHYLFRKGIACRHYELWEQVISYYNKALYWYNWDVEMHYRLAYAYIQKEEFNQAIKEYQIVREMAPDYGFVYRNLGVIMLQKREWPQAAAYFLQSLRINPYDQISLNNILQLRKKRIMENSQRETSGE